MDATVEQTDGYRFVYTLPFSPELWLVEDTYYSLDQRLDRVGVRARVEAAARTAGIAGQVVREESGVLPIVIDGQPARFWPRGDGARLGLRAGLFHPTTGYSLGLALKAAVALAEQPLPCSPAQLAAWTRQLFIRNWRGTAFYRALNQLMFRAGAPGERYRVLEHFYRLDAALVARFYSGRLTARDKLRILTGKPPVPVARAVGALLGRRATWQT
jgi:lycopene beta-cyclase